MSSFSAFSSEPPFSQPPPPILLFLSLFPGTSYSSASFLEPPFSQFHTPNLPFLSLLPRTSFSSASLGPSYPQHSLQNLPFLSLLPGTSFSSASSSPLYQLPILTVLDLISPQPSRISQPFPASAFLSKTSSSFLSSGPQTSLSMKTMHLPLCAPLSLSPERSWPVELSFPDLSASSTACFQPPHSLFTFISQTQPLHHLKFLRGSSFLLLNHPLLWPHFSILSIGLFCSS